jgi:hypothetical protein
MKTFLSFLSLLSLLSILTLFAPTTAQIPTCASACISNAVATAAPSCGVNNLVCQCQPNTLSVIVEAATPCVIQNCTNPIGLSPLSPVSHLPLSVLIKYSELELTPPSRPPSSRCRLLFRSGTCLTTNVNVNLSHSHLSTKFLSCCCIVILCLCCTGN